MNIQSEIENYLIKDFSNMTLKELEYEYKILYLLSIGFFGSEHVDALDAKLVEVDSEIKKLK